MADEHTTPEEKEIVIDTVRTFKTVYAVSFPDGTLERKEQIVEGKNEFDVQRALCKETFNKTDDRKVIKIVSINELDTNGKEIIKEGKSANVI